MPINREARLKTASVLAAYLRGEVDNFALDEIAMGKAGEDDALHTLQLSLWFTYDDFKSHPICTSSEGWDLLCRTIAFLKTDIEQLPSISAARSRWAKRLVALTSFVSIALAIYLAHRFSNFYLLLPGLLIGLPHIIYCRLEPWKNVEDKTPFYPFSTEVEWLQYEPLIAKERLPTFDPAIHGQPIRSRFVSSVMLIPGTFVAAFVLIPFMWAFQLFLPITRRSSVRP